MTTGNEIPREIREGLQKEQKRIPSKYFYDERGSRLFERITDLPEYYLTRTEWDILESNIDAIATHFGASPVMVELGSGSSKKTRLLLDHLHDVSAYIPVDISGDFLSESVRKLKQEYPGLRVRPVVADYTRPFDLPEKPPGSGKTTVFYPGSTIGNFTPGQARSFLKSLAGILETGDGMLIGVDLKKDPEILNAAYNDSAGLTARFNKNILRRLNREYDMDFDLEAFDHRAFYNEKEGRVEMHLLCRSEHTVRLDGDAIVIREGESIHTENSYKYSPAGFRELVKGIFSVEKMWTDDKDWFSVQYLEKNRE